MRNVEALQTGSLIDTRSAALVEVCAVAGAIALGALVRVPVPFSPVPATLQVLPVLLAAFAVGRSRATAGALLYVALGMAGVPLLAAPFGPTFGYLLAFIAVPSVVARFRSPLAGCVAGMGVIYAVGTLWLSFWLGCSPLQAIAMGILPFVAIDALKVAAAVKLARRFYR